MSKKLIFLIIAGFFSTVGLAMAQVWTQQTNSIAAEWTCIASSADGNRLIAASFDGSIYTSPDAGDTWITVTICGIALLLAVARGQEVVAPPPVYTPPVVVTPPMITPTFIINPDETYSQSLTSGGTILYTNQGRWQINGGNVIFRDVYLAMDVWDLNKGQPVRTGMFRAFWDPNVPSIVFSDDRHFWVDKQPGNPAKKP